MKPTGDSNPQLLLAAGRKNTSWEVLLGKALAFIQRIQNRPRGYFILKTVYISQRRLSSLYLLGSAVLILFQTNEAHGLSNLIFIV